MSLSLGHLQSHWSQYNFGGSGVKLLNINKTFPGVVHLRTSAHYEKVHSWALFSDSLSQCTSCHCVRTSCSKNLMVVTFLASFLAGQGGLQWSKAMNGFKFWLRGWSLLSYHIENITISAFLVLMWVMEKSALFYTWGNIVQEGWMALTIMGRKSVAGSATRQRSRVPVVPFSLASWLDHSAQELHGFALEDIQLTSRYFKIIRSIFVKN